MATITKKCPECGNWTEGNINRSTTSKSIRGIVKKGGMKLVLSPIGGIPGFIAGAAIDAVAGDAINEIVNNAVDQVIPDSQFSFTCPKCGHHWVENCHYDMDNIIMLSDDDVQTIKDVFIEKLGIDISNLSPDTEIMNDLGADELDMVDLVMELNNQLDIDIPEAESIYMGDEDWVVVTQTLGDLIRCIDHYVSLQRGYINTEQSTELSAEEQEYVDALKEYLSDGEISERERKMLDRVRKALGITEDRAAQLESALNQPTLSDDEKEYLEAYREYLVDGAIDEKSRKRLDIFRKGLGLSEDRAKEIEQM